MDDTACSKEKLSQSLLPRQSKPFIDHNLQFQIQEDDLTKSQMAPSHSPIYAHYMGNTPAISPFASQINEGELNQAMNGAEHSYKAWQEMKQQLTQAMNLSK